jgi:hypothetical protein
LASHFKIAADAAFTTNVTEFYQDPVGGEYDPEYEWEGRGSVLPCLSGVQIQDFGVDMQDRKILIRDNDAMKQSHVDALDAKWPAKDGQWYFTDGIYVFKVQFQRSPRGWRKWLNTKLYFKGLQISQPPPERYVWYSYEIILLVRECIG